LGVCKRTRWRRMRVRRVGALGLGSTSRAVRAGNSDWGENHDKNSRKYAVTITGYHFWFWTGPQSLLTTMQVITDTAHGRWDINPTRQRGAQAAELQRGAPDHRGRRLRAKPPKPLRARRVRAPGLGSSFGAVRAGNTDWGENHGKNGKKCQSLPFTATYCHWTKRLRRGMGGAALGGCAD
jgi:hypothetical protein